MSYVAIALSGGADSVVAFHKNLDKIDVAIHINYNLRGEESVRDMLFCIDLCKQFGKEIRVHQFTDVEEAAKESGMGLEEYARKLRYDIFNSDEYSQIVLGHHADDLAETILFRIVRGTGLNGIMPIHEYSGKFWRPILGMTKAEVIEYAEHNSLSYVTDSTNLECDYTRNLIRNKIMPLLTEINMFASCNIIKLAERAEEAYNFQSESTANIVESILTDGISIQTLQSFKSDIKHNIILEALKRCDRSVYALTEGMFKDIILMIERGSNGAYKKIGDIFVYIHKGSVYVEKFVENKIDETTLSEDVAARFNIDTDVVFDNDFVTFGGTRYVDSRRRLVVRNHRDGDVIKINGMHKKVAQYLGDLGVPKFKRKSVAVVADFCEVYWICI